MSITGTRRATTGLGTSTVPTLMTLPEVEGMLDRSLREIRQAISRRAYELCQSRGFYHGNDLDDWYRAESELLRFVAVEVVENENEVKVLADVPGFDPKDITVQLEANRLLIRGKTEHSQERHKGNLTYSERLGNEIFRVVNLPTEVDSDKANAVVRDGVLELTLPKSESAKSKRLQVKAAVKGVIS